MAAADPILDLSTLIPDRPLIRIDGATYHLRSPDELTLAESLQFARWGRQIADLSKAPDQEADLEQLLRSVAAAALADVPDEVKSRLSLPNNLAIVEVFTVLLLGRRAGQAGAIAGTVQSTGHKPSRGSSTPLAATPDGGSTPRQPPSSGPT